jgi:hypothetical protein
MKFSSLVSVVSSSLTVIGLTVLASTSSAKAASLTFNQSNLNLYGGSTPVNFDIKLDDLGDGKVQVKVDVANGYFADLRGLFFNISDDSLLKTLTINQSLYKDVTTFSAAGGLKSIGSNSNNLNGGSDKVAFDLGVEIGDEGIGQGKGDIRSTTFVIEDTSKKLSVNSFSQQSFGIRMMSVGTSANNRGGSSKLTATSLPSVVVPPAPKPEPKPVEEKPVEEKPVVTNPAPAPTVPPVVVVPPAPKPEQKPVEVPEPGATAALVLATLAAAKFAKRKKEIVA